MMKWLWMLCRRGLCTGSVERVPAERHVADRGGEAAVRYAGGFEAFVADLGRGVEQRGDRRGDVVGFDADHVCCLGCVPDECAAAAARFEYAASGESRRP